MSTAIGFLSRYREGMKTGPALDEALARSEEDRRTIAVESGLTKKILDEPCPTEHILRAMALIDVDPEKFRQEAAEAMRKLRLTN